jgi:hypothetical protein
MIVHLHNLDEVDLMYSSGGKIISLECDNCKHSIYTDGRVIETDPIEMYDRIDHIMKDYNMHPDAL